MSEQEIAPEARTVLPRRHVRAAESPAHSPFSGESQQSAQPGTGNFEIRSEDRYEAARVRASIAQACHDLFSDTPSKSWLRNAARLTIQVGIIIAGLVVLAQISQLGMARLLGDTAPVRLMALILVAVLYGSIYQATSVRQKQAPAAWSSVALVLVELIMLGVMFPFLVILVQGLFPKDFLNRVFDSDHDWMGPAILILVIFIGTRGWTRYLQRASQAAQAKAAAEIYERLAFEDGLTGLANRRRFEACVSEWLKPESLAQQSLSLLLIDVDRFKKINDGYSHNVGDTVLRRIAQVLTENLEPSDLVARLAGDEFVVVLCGYSDVKASDACRRLAQAVEDFEWGRVADGLNVSISIGHANASAGESLSELLLRSDEQMYRSKRERNT